MVLKFKIKINLYKTELYLTSSHTILEEKITMFIPYAIKCIFDVSHSGEKGVHRMSSETWSLGKGRVRNELSSKYTIDLNIN